MELTRATTTEHLNQILALQQANLYKNVEEKEAKNQGYVTAEHTFEKLKTLNDKEAHIIAIENNTVIAYALAMHPEVAPIMPIFNELFSLFNSLNYKGKPIASHSYICVGQVCVAKEFRGKGLFKKMYAYYKSCLNEKYDFTITDIAANNTRSLKAHKNIGFKVLEQYFDGPTQKHWDIVLWDWT